MSIFDTLSHYGVVPVIALDDARDALPLADALLEGGLSVVEITFRTAAALDAGARFALSPGVDVEVLVYAASAGLPFAPGIMTPSELQAALKADCKMVKFFPAMLAGGPNMLKNIAAPYAHTGIGFNPTGGVTLDNLGDWLALPEVRAVGGTWIAPRAEVAAGNWSKITENARAAVARVRELRSTQ